eukprot:UN02929
MVVYHLVSLDEVNNTHTNNGLQFHEKTSVVVVYCPIHINDIYIRLHYYNLYMNSRLQIQLGILPEHDIHDGHTIDTDRVPNFRLTHIHYLNTHVRTHLVVHSNKMILHRKREFKTPRFRQPSSS